MEVIDGGAARPVFGLPPGVIVQGVADGAGRVVRPGGRHVSAFDQSRHIDKRRPRRAQQQRQAAIPTLQFLVLDQGRGEALGKQIVRLRLRFGFGERGLRFALRLLFHRVRLSGRLRDILIRFYHGLGELIFLLLRRLLSLDFLIERPLQWLRQVNLADAKRYQRQMAAVEFGGEDIDDILDHLRAFGRGNLFPGVF